MFGLSEKVATAIVGVLAAIALALGVWALALRSDRDAARLLAAREKAAHAQTVADYRQASAQAEAADQARARATEARYSTIVQDRTDALTKSLAAARDDARRYAAIVQRPAAPAVDPGRGDHPHLPALAGGSGGAARPGAPAELDDAEACAAGIVKAEAWQAFWREVKAAADADQDGNAVAAAVQRR